MERLVFIKHLHHSATDKAEEPQPMASSAVLTFHDAVEHFLHLSAEHFDANVGTSIKFMEYWNDIKQKSSNDVELSGKTTMKRLHEARGNLKHKGIFPDESNIISFSNDVDDFFYKNTPKVFGMDYSEISLVGLVSHSETQEILRRAEDLLEKGKRVEALCEAAIAYRNVLFEFERHSGDVGRESLLDFGTSMTFQKSTFINTDNRDLDRFIDKVHEYFETLEKELLVMGLNVDYRDFLRFRYLTPVVRRRGEGFEAYPQQTVEDDHFTDRDVQFAIEFVVEVALSLQKLSTNLRVGLENH